jgi:hypothetical protein
MEHAAHDIAGDVTRLLTLPDFERLKGIVACLGKLVSLVVV